MKNHGTRGKRKYTCGECGAGQFLHWTETSRAGRPRCVGCGSARLEISADGAGVAAETLGAALAKAELVERNGTGSVMPQRMR